jgi:copper ion binding protein
MRNFAFIFILAIVVAACGNQTGRQQAGEDAAKTEAISPENLQVIEIAVNGMTCQGCEHTIQTAVGNLPGVQEVKASHLDSTAIVTFDKTKVTFGQMQAAINDKGYEALSYQVIKPQ